LAAKEQRSSADRLLVQNRRARFEYEIQERLEAGIALLGSEVKAIREGGISLAESFCQFIRGELWLMHAHVAEYELAHRRNHEPLRPRKLLLHRRELQRLEDAAKLDGVTIVPLSVYLKDRRIKVEIGVAKGKKVHDKRATIKEREQKRDMRRALRERG
jgi:SsrA-binding protein